MALNLQERRVRDGDSIVRYWPVISIYIALLTCCWGGLPVVAQTSQQRGQLPADSNWSSSLSWSTSKNMDYYADYFTRLGSSLQYGFSDKLALGVGFGYSQPIDDAEDKVRRYGFEDISLSIVWPEISKSPGSSLSGSLSAVLPTSRASQKASLMTSVEMGLNYSVRWKKFGIGTSHALIFSHYEYDTADEFGYVVNAPYGLNNSIMGTLYFHPRVSLSAGGGVYLYQTYTKQNKQVNSVRSSLSVRVTRNWNIAAGYSWRDTLLTNNSFLDDDTTVASLSMSYSF